MAPIASTAAALCFLLLLAATVSNAALANSSSNSSSHSNAAAASCPDQPVNLAALSSSSSAPPTTCRVLIVGGGAAGMFSAYMLRELGSGVCVVERKTVWGGKLQSLSAGNSTDTDSPDNAGIGTAGLWIHGEQTDVRWGAHCRLPQLLPAWCGAVLFQPVYGAGQGVHVATQAKLLAFYTCLVAPLQTLVCACTYLLYCICPSAQPAQCHLETSHTRMPAYSTGTLLLCFHARTSGASQTSSTSPWRRATTTP